MKAPSTTASDFDSCRAPAPRVATPFRSAARLEAAPQSGGPTRRALSLLGLLGVLLAALLALSASSA